MFWINCVAAQILRDHYGFTVFGVATHDTVSSQFMYGVELHNRQIVSYVFINEGKHVQVSHTEVLEMCLLPTAEAVDAYLNSIRPSDDELVAGA